MEQATALTVAEFNDLKSDRDKWKNWKDMKGDWLCGGCKGVLDDGPHCASPFSGASIHCNGCDFKLTRRTGGGQSDPFNWILKATS